MKKLFSLTAVLMTVCILMCGMGASAVENGISVMCVGASNTYGNKVPGGYRSRLYKRLTAANIPVTFVGPNTGNPSDDLPADSVGHAGYGGSYIGVIAEQIDGWMQAYRPQVVCLMMGTNDMLQNNKNRPDDTREGAPERYSALIDRMMAICPDSEYYVANITSLGTGWNQYVLEYNAAVEAMLETKPSNVHFVDVYSACPDRSTDIQSDGIHITAEGYEKVAQAFYDVMQPKLSTMEPSGTSGLERTSKSGNFMLKMAALGTKTSRSATSSTIAVEKDTDYEFSFWVKGDSGTTILAKVVDSATSSKQLTAKTAATGPNWAQYVLSFNSGDYTGVKIAFLDSSAEKGTVYADDVVLKKVGTEDNIAVNPSFEDGASGWTLQKQLIAAGGADLFTIAASKTYVVPPKSYSVTERDILKRVDFNFDTFNSKGNSTQIENTQIGSLYADPEGDPSSSSDKQGTATSLVYKETDSEGNVTNGCLMINPKTGSQNARAGLKNADITMFDEVKFNIKFVKRPTRDYSGKSAKDFPLKFKFVTYTNGVAAGSNEVVIYPDDMEGEYKTVTFKRSDFAGSKVDMNGTLKYTDSKNIVTLQLQATSGMAVYIDDLSFLWYAGGDVQEITSVNFMKNGESINADGIKAGEITIETDAANSGSFAVADAALAAAVVEKSTNKIVDIGIAKYSVPAQGEAKGIACTVTVPQDYANYEIRVMHMENLAKFRPAAPVMTFDTNGASGQE